MVRGEPLKTEDELTVANVFQLAVGAWLLPQFPASPSVEQVVDGCAGYVERKLSDDGDWTLVLLSALPRERLGLELEPRPARSETGDSSDHVASAGQRGGPGSRGRPEINREPLRISLPAEPSGGDRAGASRRIVAAYEPSPPFEWLARWKAKLCRLDVNRRDVIRAARETSVHGPAQDDRPSRPGTVRPPPPAEPGPGEELEVREERKQRMQAMESAIAALPDGLDRAIAEVRWSQRLDPSAGETWEEALDRLAAKGFVISEQAARQRLRRTVERAALDDYLNKLLATAKREWLLTGHEETPSARTELIEAARGRWRADRALRDRYKRSTALGALRHHEKSTPPAEPAVAQASEESEAWLVELEASDEVGHAALVALLGLETLPAGERLSTVAREIEYCCGFTESEDQLRRRVRSLAFDAKEDLRRKLLALLD